MSVPASVRLAAPEDAERLLALQLALDEQSAFMMLEPGERHTTVDQVGEELASQLGFYLVADPGPDQPLAGYTQVYVEPYRRASRTGYLVLGVDSRYAGQGLGGRLLREAIEEGRRHGLRRIELTVMTHNERALRLYLSSGFKVEGLRRACLIVDGAEVDEYYMAILL